MEELQQYAVVEDSGPLLGLPWRGSPSSPERNAVMRAAMADRKVRTIGAEASADPRTLAIERTGLYRVARTLSGGTMKLVTRTDTRPGPTQGHLLWQVVDAKLTERE